MPSPPPLSTYVSVRMRTLLTAVPRSMTEERNVDVPEEAEFEATGAASWSPDSLEHVAATLTAAEVGNRGWPVERLFCKRPIQFLASSKILTPHPLTARRVCIPPPPAFGCGGRTHLLGREG
jgi:hypothetical protein